MFETLQRLLRRTLPLTVLLSARAAAQGSPAPPALTPPPPPPGARAEQPLPAPLSAAEALDPSGGRVGLAPGAEAIVDPGSTFRVVLPGRSDDARLSLVDAADALVPATSAREVGETTVLTVAPTRPLTPASRYLLRLDGVRGRDLHDAVGRPAGPVELPLVVAGSPPEPVRKAKRKRTR